MAGSPNHSLRYTTTTTTVTRTVLLNHLRKNRFLVLIFLGPPLDTRWHSIDRSIDPLSPFHRRVWHSSRNNSTSNSTTRPTTTSLLRLPFRGPLFFPHEQELLLLFLLLLLTPAHTHDPFTLSLPASVAPSTPFVMTDNTPHSPSPATSTVVSGPSRGQPRSSRCRQLHVAPMLLPVFKSTI